MGADETKSDLDQIRTLLWGLNSSTETFGRWSQGFIFSPGESSALVQCAGGPCAILAPIQAYMLKEIISKNPPGVFPQLTVPEQERMLVTAMAEILIRCAPTVIIIVFRRPSKTQTTTEPSCTVTAPPEPSPSTSIDEASQSDELKRECLERKVVIQLEECVQSSVDLFHNHLDALKFHDHNQVQQYLNENIQNFCGDYGILLFLYSVLMTKGLVDLKAEVGDLTEPLIHEVYGYGSQSLVNLMLTGRAVQYVWDNDQDVGGLTLKGIDKQSDIGFVTLMEHMRYCTVGTFLKSPKFPIWVLGSETHLTVAFSFDNRLALPEQTWEKARRIFRTYDRDGNNFIHFSDLPLVLNALELVSEMDYIEVMRPRLDSENLGIVLLTNFMEEYFPGAKSLVPETFTIWHYNGLAGSHVNNVVSYVKGNAVLLESDLKSGCESDQVLTCLQTKWPNIEIQWETPNSKPPSLN